MGSHAIRGSWLGLGLALLSAIGLGALGCGAEPVVARAVWIDGLGADGTRSIHVYDRGHRYAFDVLGATDPHERMQLGPRGRGVMVRAGARAGTWFDLDDGRRLPLLLPPSTPDGDGPVHFAARGDALWWLEPSDASLSVVPLAPGVPLQRREDGSMLPVSAVGAAWAVGSLDAPRLLVKQADGSASYFRYGDADNPIDQLELEASTHALWLPNQPAESRRCQTATDCFTSIGLEPSGELAIIAGTHSGGWSIFDRRAPHQAGPLELPDPLASAASSGNLRLLHVIDRAVSVWLGAGQLYRWDRAAGIVESTPVFAKPPLIWSPVDRGRALVLLAVTGSMYRVDAQATTVLNLETTDCPEPQGAEPVVSPRGDWASWSCNEASGEAGGAAGGEAQANTSAVVRVSADGLERYIGVPMSPLALDDSGDLLLYSVESVATDEVDGVVASGRPRSLFVLSREGVLSRIDELEPAPAPVVRGAGDIATYIQAAALE
ncbi:hypothetical protein DB30_06012 [Enhygromyxa salina]|uniref:Uncharacterized protein n=1 Tax=Enhygromyxa salina TaxID=215803 RepID=A0A0C1ZBK7_9BACT|nr:hypothetical protein [Enhygromyxa salina]KIG15104.1 hypothetical protein DB30_06012 [Enhygromyxa salina]